MFGEIAPDCVIPSNGVLGIDSVEDGEMVLRRIRRDSDLWCRICGLEPLLETVGEDDEDRMLSSAEGFDQCFELNIVIWVGLACEKVGLRFFLGEAAGAERNLWRFDR